MTISEIENIFSEINPWKKNKNFRYKVLERQDSYKLDFKNPLIDILLGARRVGKTSLIESEINKLLSMNKDKIFYFSCTNPYLLKYGFDVVLKYIFDNTKDTKHLYIFIDEIQEIKDWHVYVKHFYDLTKCKFIISGSSSLIINQNASKLTGRMKIHYINSLTYPQAIKFNKKYTLLDYLENGGYPEIVLGKVEAEEILDIVKSSLYRDLIILYGIRNTKILMDILILIASSLGNELSILSIARTISADKETIAKVVDYLESISIIFSVPIYSKSMKKSKRNPKKYYFKDTGIINKIIFQPKIGTIAENTVAIVLKDKDVNLSYYKQNSIEFDFVCNKEFYEVKYREDFLEYYHTINANAFDLNIFVNLIVPNYTKKSMSNLSAVSILDILNKS